MPTTNNSINSNSAGLMANSATGSIFGRTLTAGASTNLVVTNGSGVAGNPTVDLASLTLHGILVGEGSAAINPIVLTNGQVLVGSTGVDPVAATITAGTGISVLNAAGAITISTTGAAFGWTDVTGTSQTIAVNNAYISDNAGLVTLTLPATAALGDSFIVMGGASGTGGWKVAQNASQKINFGAQSTTTGTGGNLQSTNQFDSVTCSCIVAGASTVWAVRASQGNINVT